MFFRKVAMWQRLQNAGRNILFCGDRHEEADDNIQSETGLTDHCRLPPNADTCFDQTPETVSGVESNENVPSQY